MDAYSFKYGGKYLDCLLSIKTKIHYLKDKLTGMKFFYLTSLPNPKGQFIIHDRDCNDIPSKYDRDYLGPFNSALEAFRSFALKRSNIHICVKCGCYQEIYALMP